jgi:hypothetical protein
MLLVSQWMVDERFSRRQTMDGIRFCQSFGEEHFGAAELGDRRRTKRLVALADQIIKHPGGTLPDKVNDPASLKALYRLMNTKTVTHESVLAASRERTWALAAQVPGVVLFIQDGTELDFTSRTTLTELGQLGNGTGRGYLCHNTLAVRADTREVLGLAGQILARRPTVTNKETRDERRNRPDRESRLWKKASQTLPVPPRGTLYVDVADRGADVLEFLDAEEAQGRLYVVRAKHNRRIELEDGTKTKLFTFARQLPPGDSHSVEVQATPQSPGRTAMVTVCWAKVTLLIPKQPRGEIRGVPLKTWVVCVREVSLPEGAGPLEWILLTNIPVNTDADACMRVGWYECRWIIEEYHKAQKTGCGIETLQFTTEGALQPAIALLSITALTLLQLRDASRRPDAERRPASELVPVLCVVALSLWRYKQPRKDLSVHEFFTALARLGGHQNRKHDHRPGWIVLWRGWTKLQCMTEALASIGYEKCG